MENDEDGPVSEENHNSPPEEGEDPDWCLDDEEGAMVDDDVSDASHDRDEEMGGSNVTSANQICDDLSAPTRSENLVSVQNNRKAVEEDTRGCEELCTSVQRDSVHQCNPESQTKEKTDRPHLGLINTVHVRCSPRLGRKPVNASLLILGNRKSTGKVSKKSGQSRKSFGSVSLEHISGDGQHNGNGVRWKQNVHSTGGKETRHTSAPSEHAQIGQGSAPSTDGTNDNGHKAKEVQQKYIDRAIVRYKQRLRCVQCLEIGTLAKNGTTRFHGKILKCNACNKQVTGKAVIGLIEEQIGKGWENVCREEAEHPEIRKENNTPTHLAHETASLTTPPISVAENDTTKYIQQGNDKRSSQGSPAFTTVPTQLWLSTLESVKSLTAAQQQLLIAQEKLTKALETANERIKRLENEISVNAHPLNIENSIHEEERLTQNRNIGGVAMDIDQTTAAQIPTVGPTEEAREDQSGGISKQNKDANGVTRQVNWLEVAKRNTSPARVLPPALDQRIRKSIDLLNASRCRKTVEPNPTAVYFKNVRRGPIGAIRTALRASLPSWALLGIGFIGGSVLEIVTDVRLKTRLVATLKIMGIDEIRGFDVLSGGIKKGDASDGKKEHMTKNLETAIKRLSTYVKQNRCEYATRWYKGMLQKAKTQMDEMEGTKTVVPENIVRELHQDKALVNGGEVPTPTQPSVNVSGDDEGWTTVGASRASAQRVQHQPDNLLDTTAARNHSTLRTNPEERLHDPMEEQNVPNCKNPASSK